MKRLLFFVLFFYSLMSHIVRGQAVAIDSLKQLLTLQINDTLKTNILVELVTLTTHNEQQVHLAQLKNNIATHAAALNATSTLYLFYKYKQATYLQLQAYAYRNVGAYAAAVVYYQKSMLLYVALNNKVKQCQTLFAISELYYLQANIAKAIDCCLKGLRLAQQIHNTIEEASAIQNLAVFYQSQKSYDKAIYYYKKAITLDSINKDNGSLAVTYNNIATLYRNNGSTKTARYYVQKSLTLLSTMPNNEEIAHTYTLLGSIYFKENKAKEALPFFIKSLAIANTTNINEDKIYALIYIGEIYLYQQSYVLARTYLTQALAMATTQGAIRDVYSASDLLAQLYTKTGNYKQALIMQSQAIQLRDSIQNQRNKTTIEEQQYKYEYEKKQTALLLLQKQNELVAQANIAHKNKVIYLLIASLLGSGFVLVILLLYNRQRKLKAVQKSLLTKQKLLRLQMNPHFIFNALTALQGLINTDKKQDASFYLTKIARLIRSVLEDSRQEHILLSKEITNLENYLNVNKLLLNNAFDYTITVAPNLLPEAVLLPPMLIQPFVENALVHGIANAINRGCITIFLGLNNDNLVVEITDNGLGIQHTTTTVSEHHSLSTAITKERLANILRLPTHKVNISITNIHSNTGSIIGAKTSFEIPILNT